MSETPQITVVAEHNSGALGKLQQFGTALENGLLILLLGVMMFLAVGQIVLRLAFNSGFIWADELLKILVLWIALVASVAASRSQRHLRIDILSHFVPLRYARLPGTIVDAFAALICGVVAWHSIRYVGLAIDFGDTVLVDIPSWVAHVILPIAFTLMCYRFALASIKGMAEMLHGFRKVSSE